MILKKFAVAGLVAALMLPSFGALAQETTPAAPADGAATAPADGSLPASHQDEARAAYLEEGTPLRPSGKVAFPAAYWQPGACLAPARRVPRGG